MKKLGFVIVNYNDYKETINLVNIIKNYSCIDKIVIVDNNSSDNSVEELKKIENDKISIIEEQNNNYIKCLNDSAKYLIEELEECNIFYTEPDIIINKEADIQKLNDDIGKYSIGIVSPTIVEDRKLQRGSMLPNIDDEIKFNLLIFGKKHEEKLKYHEKHYQEDVSIIGLLSSNIFCIDSGVIKSINYFDENASLYLKNTISIKLEEIDKQIAVDNNVVIVHKNKEKKYIDEIRYYKEKKKSQYYFVKEYLKANEKELKKLNFYMKVSLLFVRIKNLFKSKK